MSIEYDEKREYYRMNTNSPIKIKPDGSDEVYEGMCVNLSANGVLFTTTQRFEPGSIVHINMTPAKTVVAPLDAMVEIVRSQVDSDKGYTIAGQIKQMR
jgi:hypothetical protein